MQVQEREADWVDIFWHSQYISNCEKQKSFHGEFDPGSG